MTTPRMTASKITSVEGANDAFSPEVVAFAAAYQAEHCLQPLLEATFHLFPTANFVKVYVEEDPELSYNTQIIFDVQIEIDLLEEIRVPRRQWQEESTRLFPPLRKFLFCLLLDLKRATRTSVIHAKERAMSAADIVFLVRARPFRPFRLCLSDGTVYEVLQSGLVIVTPTSAVVGSPARGQLGVAERIDIVSLEHIARVEFFHAPERADASAADMPLYVNKPLTGEQERLH